MSPKLSYNIRHVLRNLLSPAFPRPLVSNSPKNAVGNHPKDNRCAGIALQGHGVVEEIVRHDDGEHLSGGHDHGEHVGPEALDRVKNGELTRGAADRRDDVVIQRIGIVGQKLDDLRHLTGEDQRADKKKKKRWANVLDWVRTLFGESKRVSCLHSGDNHRRHINAEHHLKVINLAIVTIDSALPL